MTSPSTSGRRAAVALAAVQVLDVVGNEAAPPRRVTAHLDHLGLPRRLHPALTPIKLATAGALVLGSRRLPAVGAVTAAGLVAFYAAATTFHLRAGDDGVVAAPAAACGVAAAYVLTDLLARSGSDTRLRAPEGR